jgi:hypothetical protein
MLALVFANTSMSLEVQLRPPSSVATALSMKFPAATLLHTIVYGALVDSPILDVP